MAFRINHIHLKGPDPKKTADWYVQAFNFKIVSDEVRPVGDRFIRCTTEDGSANITISGARTGETPAKGDAGVHYGLEHFGIDSADVDADVARLVALGAKLQEGPLSTPTGVRVAFLAGPDDVRLELVGRVKS